MSNEQERKSTNHYREKLNPTEENLKKLERSFAKARIEGMKKYRQGKPSQFVEVKD